MDKRLLTVSEFADRAGVSKQRIYQLLNKRLKEFVQEVDGKKMIDISALDGFNSQEPCSSVEQGVETPTETAAALELLKTTVAMLKEQLEAKDKTIHELTAALQAEQLQTSQAQALHGGSMRQLLEAEDSEQKEPRTKAPGFFKKLFKKHSETM